MYVQEKKIYYVSPVFKTLLRFSVAKSKISLGKCHIAVENMWIIFKLRFIQLSLNF